MSSVKQYNIAWEKVPYEWQSEPVLVQRFTALRLISIFQLAYAILEYGVVAATYFSNPKSSSSLENIIDLIQTYGGMSVLSIIAALLLRIRVGADKTVTLVKAYSVLVGIDFVAWIARTVYYLKGQIDGGWAIDINRLTAIIFTGILLLIGIIEGVRVIIEASKQRYSLINDGNEESSHAHRASQAYYPIRFFAILQLAYTILGGYLRIFISARDGEDFGVLILLTPAAGICTLIAIAILFIKKIGKSVLTYYAILIVIDLLTGVLRVIGGVIYQLVYLKQETDSLQQEQDFFIFVSISTAVPLFYWILGVLVAYRTRVHIELDTNITSELDRVFGI